MKAFLSHSSKDKHFVRQVADHLGDFECEYDEYTFESTLNAAAIRRSLSRSQLFVLFLSENSTRSSYVSEECRSALEARAAGNIQKCLVISLDDTTYKALPSWLQETNVSSKLSSPVAVARKISALLLALTEEQSRAGRVIIPRETEAAILRSQLGQPVGKAPVVIHVVGFDGVGRRTLLTSTLTSLFPGSIGTFPPLTLDQFEGANEFYRRLSELFEISSVAETIRKYEEFSKMDEDSQVNAIVGLLVEAVTGDEFVMIEDRGGVYTDEGDYQPFLKKLVSAIAGYKRPVLGFIQRRMMPFALQQNHNGSFHMKLEPMNNAQISDLLRFSLRSAEIDYTPANISDICELLDGNPVNTNMAVNVIKRYGLDSFIADPSLFVMWKRGRMEDFLNRIKFTNSEISLLAMLADYRFMSFELISGVCELSIHETTKSLRNLEDLCCIGRSGDLYSISSALIDSVGRDKRFKQNSKQKKAIADRILDMISRYSSEDKVPIALMEAATRASVITDKDISGFATRLILPSYYITIARKAYDDDKRMRAIEFCKRAWGDKERLSVEGQIEILRIWGLSSARLGENEGLEFATTELAKYKGKSVAKRNLHFLKGFYLRLKKRFDEAEVEFLSAYELAKGNMSINRELANLYRHRHEFAEGEAYARRAYNVAPTNPYIIDVFLECLLGKSAEGLKVDISEIARLFEDLQRYGDVPGSSFFQTRLAQDFQRRGKLTEALACANKAIERTPAFLPCRYQKAEILLKLADGPGARAEFNAISDILDRQEAFSQDEEGRIAELEARILIEEHSFSSAAEILKNSPFLPVAVYRRLAKKLASAISMFPKYADSRALQWLKEYEASQAEADQESASKRPRASRRRGPRKGLPRR